MAAPVNSDRSLRRGRGGVWRWLTRRFGPVVVTLAALIFVNWITPRLDGRSPAPQYAEADLAPQPRKSAETALKPLEKPGWTDAAAAPAMRLRVRRRQPHFSAPDTPQDDGFDVLSADELDAISQAH